MVTPNCREAQWGSVIRLMLFLSFLSASGKDWLQRPTTNDDRGQEKGTTPSLRISTHTERSAEPISGWLVQAQPPGRPIGITAAMINRRMTLFVRGIFISKCSWYMPIGEGWENQSHHTV